MAPMTLALSRCECSANLSISVSQPCGLTEPFDSGFSGWKIGDGWITVGPHSEIKGRNPQPGRIILNIESSDVRDDFAKLQAAGAKVVREPYRMEGWPENAWVATLADLDDNYFQLVSPM